MELLHQKYKHFKARNVWFKLLSKDVSSCSLPLYQQKHESLLVDVETRGAWEISENGGITTDWPEEIQRGSCLLPTSKINPDGDKSGENGFFVVIDNGLFGLRFLPPTCRREVSSM